jgi:hypothetical protein
MSVFQESGLQITLPVGESFRFQDCPNYQNLKGKNLSEMDFSDLRNNRPLKNI